MLHEVHWFSLILLSHLYAMFLSLSAYIHACMHMRQCYQHLPKLFDASSDICLLPLLVDEMLDGIVSVDKPPAVVNVHSVPQQFLCSGRGMFAQLVHVCSLLLTSDDRTRQACLSASTVLVCTSLRSKATKQQHNIIMINIFLFFFLPFIISIIIIIIIIFFFFFFCFVIIVIIMIIEVVVVVITIIIIIIIIINIIIIIITITTTTTIIIIIIIIIFFASSS